MGILWKSCRYHLGSSMGIFEWSNLLEVFTSIFWGLVGVLGVLQVNWGSSIYLWRSGKYHLEV